MFKAVSTPLLDLKDWKFSVDQWGIGWAVFDREGESQNSLGRRPFEELGAIVQEAEKGAAASTIRGLVISSGTRPLRFVSIMGVFFALIGLAVSVISVVQKAVGDIKVQGWT